MLYFVPHLRLPDQPLEGTIDGRLTRVMLDQARGLREQLGDCTDARDVSVFELKGRGPGGLPGLLVAPLVDGRPPRLLGYYQDQQVWHDVSEPDAPLWVGWDKLEPPTPENLARPDRLPGHDLRLGDGQLWHVPIVRQPDGDDGLPRVYSRRGREWFSKIAPQYVAIWEEAGRIHELLVVEGEDFDLEPVLDFCCHVLALNYRVSGSEVSLLGLLNSKTYLQVVGAALGILAMLGPAKKNDIDSASSTPGSGDVPPAIDPAATSCGSPPTSTPEPSLPCAEPLPHPEPDPPRRRRRRGGE